MATRRIRVGVIGLGFGLYHIRGYQQCPDVEVFAVCARTDETVKNIAREYGIRHAVTDYRALLAMEEIEAVSICSPVYLHHGMTLEAIKAGKHVLSEKPLALDRMLGQEMLDRATQAGIIHMTNFGWRFNNAAYQLKSMMEQGWLGDLFHINARYLMAYRADPAVPHGWRDQRNLGGMGALGDLGVHLIDMVRWWAGDFEAVLGSMQAPITERRNAATGNMEISELEDASSFLASIEGGVQGVFHVSRCAIGSNYFHVDLHGSQGSLSFQFDRDTMQATLFGSEGLQGERKDITPHDIQTPSPQQHFVNGVRSGQAVQPGFHEGVKVQQVADALAASAERRAWAQVPDF